jgi:CubicO group peptidase (beta-lactamase class C family)
MKSLVLLLFFQFVVCIGISNERSNPISQSEKISAALREVILQEKIPGIIAAISSSEGILAIGSEGVRKIGIRDTVTNHDLIHLGSCTKAMTALMLAALVGEGLIRWDTQLIEVLPELKEAIHADYYSITIWQLLTHRSRVPANAENWWKHRNLELKKRRLEILKENLKAEPTIELGAYRYSNLGYMIAGCMAEKLTRDTWESLMQKRIFKPLDMKTAGFGPPGAFGKNEQPWGHRRSGSDWQPRQFDNAQSLGPAGRVHCTLEDWAKFLSLQLPNQKGKLFDQKLLQKLVTPSGQYAGGWIVLKRSWGRGVVLTHSGSNSMWHAVVWVAPKLDRTFIVATNSKDKNSHSICDKLIGELIKIDRDQKN